MRKLELEIASNEKDTAESTLDASLKLHLAAVHQKVVSGDAGIIVPDDFLSKGYDDEQLTDVEFWDHGTTAPKEVGERYAQVDVDMMLKTPSKKQENKDKLLVVDELNKWAFAFDELDIKYGKKALAFFELKQVYAMKRQALKDAQEKNLQYEENIARLDQQTKKAVKTGAKVEEIEQQKQVISRELVKVTRQLTAKKCGCGKTFCTTTCGCRKNGFKCGKDCGCGGEGDCCNPATYDIDERSQEVLVAAITACVAKKTAEISEKYRRRVEGGQL